MEFTSSEDIEAPLDEVFAKLSDFDAIERQMLRRGVEVKRREAYSEPVAGMTWDASFSFRGKARDAEITLSKFDKPEHMEFTSISSGLEVVTQIDCVPLSRSRTRIAAKVALNPRTLPARLLVQSMKLARTKLNKRFAKRMREFARDFENKLRAA